MPPTLVWFAVEQQGRAAFRSQPRQRPVLPPELRPRRLREPGRVPRRELLRVGGHRRITALAVESLDQGPPQRVVRKAVVPRTLHESIDRALGGLPGEAGELLVLESAQLHAAELPIGWGQIRTEPRRF